MIKFCMIFMFKPLTTFYSAVFALFFVVTFGLFHQCFLLVCKSSKRISSKRRIPKALNVIFRLLQTEFG